MKESTRAALKKLAAGYRMTLTELCDKLATDETARADANHNGLIANPSFCAAGAPAGPDAAATRPIGRLGTWGGQSWLIQQAHCRATRYPC
jgi:hypothetical protein